MKINYLKDFIGLLIISIFKYKVKSMSHEPTYNLSYLLLYLSKNYHNIYFKYSIENNKSKNLFTPIIPKS